MVSQIKETYDACGYAKKRKPSAEIVLNLSENTDLPTISKTLESLENNVYPGNLMTTRTKGLCLGRR